MISDLKEMLEMINSGIEPKELLPLLALHRKDYRINAIGIMIEKGFTKEGIQNALNLEIRKRQEK